jgi:hypothetical protein
MANKHRTPPAIAPNHLLVVGIVLWIVAWFVPVVRGQEIWGGLAGFAQAFASTPTSALQNLDGPDWLPGWTACRFAWNLLVGEETGEPGGFRHRLAGASCLANAVMLLAIVGVLARSSSRLVGLLVLACSGLTTSWIYLSDQEAFRPWAVGYYLWVASFVLVGIGLLVAPVRR